MSILNKEYWKTQKKENEDIRDYFRLCIKNIDRDNLYMLRKVNMYISMVYFVMYGLAALLMPNFKMSATYYFVLPLILVYFFINVQLRKEGIVLSTNATGNLCGAYYFLMCMIFMLMDVFGTPNDHALWTPFAMIVFPMVYIDRMFKYGVELLIIICIYTPVSYFNKAYEIFRLDMHAVLAAYIISMISAHIILNMRARAGLTMMELKQLSAIDKLTHVFNKGALLQKIENFYQTKDPDAACAMVILDIDDFKLVNDNLGHDTGDVLLENLGNILMSSFRAYDIVGRYGGDEFVVVMPTMSDVSILQARCQAMQKAISEINLGNGQPFTLSVGAVIDKGNHDSSLIFRMADDALYNSKLSGKSCLTTWVAKREYHEVTKPLIITIVKDKDNPLAMLGDGQHDYEYYTVTEIEDAIRSISQYHEHLKAIVIDMEVEMETDGFIISYLKSREGFASIPVIAVASTDEASRKAKKLGADKVHKSDMGLDKYRSSITKLIDVEEV